MSFRFWRRVKVAPGVTLNLSRSGGSLSVGPRGTRFTVGSRGQRVTAGIPGTGLFYTSTLPAGSREGRRGRPAAASVAGPSRTGDRLTLGFFKRLVTPPEEAALIDGCRELAQGHEDRALAYLERAVHLADGAYLAGLLALRKEHLDDAVRHLSAAAEKPGRLGRCFSRYGIAASMILPITDEVSACVGPDLRGVLLGLVEAYQRQDRLEPAVACLERLRRLEPRDPVVKLSLAELLLEAHPDDRAVCRKVVRMTAGIENRTAIHTALLLYQARALHRMGLLQAARDTLTKALHRRKGRSPELLRALRHQRALVYQALGQHRRARTELEKLYAEDPEDRAVADLLGIGPGPDTEGGQP